MDEWRKCGIKLSHYLYGDYCTSRKTKETLPFATAQCPHSPSMFNDKRQWKINSVWPHLYVESKTIKSQNWAHTYKNILVFARSQG